MMGQTDGQTQDRVIGGAMYRPNIRAVSVIEENAVDAISTIFVLHSSSCQYTSTLHDVTTLYPLHHTSSHQPKPPPPLSVTSFMDVPFGNFWECRL